RANLLAKDYAAFNNANFLQYTPFEEFAQQHGQPDVVNYLLGRFNPQVQPVASVAAPAASAAPAGSTPTGSYFSALESAPATPTADTFMSRLRGNMDRAISNQQGITTDASLQGLRALYELLARMFGHQEG